MSMSSTGKTAGAGWVRLLGTLGLLLLTLPAPRPAYGGTLDDEAICRQILAKLPSHVTFREHKTDRYEIVSVDRIYEMYGFTYKGRAFEAHVVAKWIMKASGRSVPVYYTPRFQLRPGQAAVSSIDQIYGPIGDKAAYQKGIAACDTFKNFRILYPKSLRRSPVQPAKPASPKKNAKPPTPPRKPPTPPRKAPTPPRKAPTPPRKPPTPPRKAPISQVALHLFTTDPSPAIAGKDFKLLFLWTAKPDAAHIQVHSPSGKLVLKKALGGRDELLFPAAVYMKHLKERGEYKLTVQAKKSGYSDYGISLTFRLIDPQPWLRWFTLSQPDKKAICSGEAVRVAVIGLKQTKIPINVSLVSSRGLTTDITGPRDIQGDKIFFKFDSRGYWQGRVQPGMYRFKIKTAMAGRRFLVRYSEPFQYFTPKDTLREVSLDGKTYELRVDTKDASRLWYYHKTGKELRRCDDSINRRLRMLAYFKKTTSDAIWQASPWLRQAERRYAAFMFTIKPSAMTGYAPARVLRASEKELAQRGVTQLAILDDLGRAYGNKPFARTLFRAADARYWAVTFADPDLAINAKDVQYVRSMTDNPAFHAVFIAQAVNSILTTPEARYKALFEDMILADADSLLLTASERKAIARAVASGKTLNTALTTMARISRSLPSGYVRELDKNWLLVRRGEQWKWLARKDTPNVGLALDLVEMFVELNHHQWVLQRRAEMLRRAGSDIIRRAPAGKRAAMSAGLKKALAWSQHTYKSGVSNALEKLIDTAKKQGISAAKALAGKLVAGANPYLLAFDVPNVLFNMDGMYESNHKAQCAADVVSAARAALKPAIARAKQTGRIEDWRKVDALYLFVYLTKDRFYHHAAAMLEKSGVGRTAGDLLTGGQTSNWIGRQRAAQKRVRGAANRWESTAGNELYLRLLVPRAKPRPK